MAAPSNPITSLSAGLLIYDILSGSAAVAAVANKVYPVVSEAESQLPYICYRRAALEIRPVKDAQGADAVSVEVLCYASTYGASVRMAEVVRAELDGLQAEYVDEDSGEKMIARSIGLADASEGWADEAYFQSLTFTIRINNYA